VSGLTEEECEGVYRWLTFYEDHKQYQYMGKLLGRFYDESGVPTKALHDFYSCAKLDENGKPIEKPPG